MEFLPSATFHSSVSAARTAFDPQATNQYYWRKIKTVTATLAGSSTEVQSIGNGITETTVRTYNVSGTANNGGGSKGYTTGTFQNILEPLDGPRWTNYFSAQMLVTSSTGTKTVTYTGPSAPPGYTADEPQTSLGFLIEHDRLTRLWKASANASAETVITPIPWDDFDRGGSWEFPFSTSINNSSGTFISTFEDSGSLIFTFAL